jgi:hypothetical protein
MANLEVNVKKAVDWIAAQLRENPGADRSALVDQASQRFGLSPLQAEFLYRQLRPPEE